MASFEKRKKNNGEYSYQVNIRKAEIQDYKTFSTEEDAKLYAWHKERLLTNMRNFEIPIEQRITIEQVFEIKTDQMKASDPKEILRFNNVKNRLIEAFGENKFIDKTNYQEWENIAKKLYQTEVYRGAQTEKGKRSMSISTLRSIFAYASAAFSATIAYGIPIDNLPLKVQQSYIKGLL
jgi:hypothetical protein